MRNKKGFVFIETIITIVVLMTTLVVLYAIYSKNVIAEKKRLYYDDVGAIYKTLAIRDVLNLTIDTAKFQRAIDDKNNSMYLYVFNIESDIYADRTLIREAKFIYNFHRLFYIKKANLPLLKTCVNGNDNSDKCKETIKMINGYASANFMDYLKTVSMPFGPSNEANGILIAMFYEAKDGGPAVAAGGYEKCIQRKILEAAGKTEASDSEKQEVIKNFNESGNISYDMSCENAYYTAWVYL